MKVRVVTEAHCIEGCGWVPTEPDVNLASRRHTGDKKLAGGGDGCFHATAVVSVPACPSCGVNPAQDSPPYVCRGCERTDEAYPDPDPFDFQQIPALVNASRRIQ